VTPAERVDAQLEALYAQVPDVGCKGLCTDACGPIDGGIRERARMARAGVRLPPVDVAIRKMASTPDNYECPALVDGRCSTYLVRPMVCFLPGTWVYTSQGPKRIEEIFAGDLVHGADGRLHRVLAARSRIFIGPIVNVRHTGTHMPCWSTSDHLWLTARQKDKRKRPDPQWRRADELIPKLHSKAGDYLCFPRAFEGPDPVKFLDVSAYVQGRREGDYLMPFTRGGRPVRGIVQKVPAEIAIDDELLFLIGLYLAEGSASIQGAEFTMHPDERDVLERVGKYLTTLGITSHVLRVKRTATLTISSALFGRLMKSLCGVGAAEKRLHPSLFEKLSHAQLWQIYEAWDLGDGCKYHPERQMTTTTVSERLAAQMTFIALSNGLFPRIYTSQRSDRNSRSYALLLFPSNWRKPKNGHGTKLMHDDQFVYTPAVGQGGQYRRGIDVIQKHYEGPVFDLQVEDAESFVTSSGVAHNCRLSPRSRPCSASPAPARGLKAFIPTPVATKPVPPTKRPGEKRHP
jgi:hypothetical protein